MSNIGRPADKPVVLPFTHSKTSDIPPPRPLPGVKWMPTTIRNHLVAFLGEFVGTFLFLFFAFAATQVANMIAAGGGPSLGALLYISLAFGFSLAVNVFVFYRISGGMFNPAVTLGLCLVGAVGWLRGVVVIASQILGAIAAAAVVHGLFPGPLLVRTTLSKKPASLVTTSVTRGLFIEMFLTILLVFTIFMMAVEKSRATFMAPIVIGLALFVAELAGVMFTGGSLNPARSFGPNVVLGKFDKEHWVYWVGPALGAIIAVLFYRFIKMLEYETANPGQDSDGRRLSKYADENPTGNNVEERV
ncbi:aquaporin-like protein [Tothia fuscella]|uniref:Aquaporin-like protein n=1 Tax=Tothia fuscella TaxID=1048955 RepID=A0A9P4NL00_9PEZI|nr:aquaporin-like protein [Tothia fuscella]